MDHPFWYIATSAHDRVVYKLPSGVLSEQCPLLGTFFYGSGGCLRNWLLRRLVLSCEDRDGLMRLLLSRVLLL